MNDQPDKGLRSKYREHVLAAREQSHRDVDRTLLSLAGGTLGLSFGIVGFGSEADGLGCLLVSTWILLGLGLLSVVVSQVASTYALDAALEEMDGVAGATTRREKWARAVRMANAIAALTTASGILMFGFFLIGHSR